MSAAYPRTVARRISFRSMFFAAAAMTTTATWGCASGPEIPVPVATFDLSAAPGCALYVGAVSGNDAEMHVRLVLCPGPQGIVGRIQFTSEESGWSVRDLAGQATAEGALVLADTAFVENHPSVIWKYCLVDRYFLSLRADGTVIGTYVSNECMDRATVSLERAG